MTRNELAERVAEAKRNGLVLKLPRSSDGYPAGWYRRTGPAQTDGPYPTATDALKAAKTKDCPKCGIYRITHDRPMCWRCDTDSH
ncbi:MAG: hypothetical protein OXH70_17450 [Acidobacteria bacterium]|nr:hypothetical protein [Acidobacteriota bacterium]